MNQSLFFYLFLLAFAFCSTNNHLSGLINELVELNQNAGLNLNDVLAQVELGLNQEEAAIASIAAFGTTCNEGKTQVQNLVQNFQTRRDELNTEVTNLQNQIDAKKGTCDADADKVQEAVNALQDNKEREATLNESFEANIKEVVQKNVAIRQLLNLCVDFLGATLNSGERPAPSAFTQIKSKVNEVVGMFKKTNSNFSTAPLIQAIVLLSQDQGTYIDQGILERLVAKIQELSDKVAAARVELSAEHDAMLTTLSDERTNLIEQIGLYRKMQAECNAFVADNSERVKRTQALTVYVERLIAKYEAQVQKWSGLCDFSKFEEMARRFVEESRAELQQIE